ncbi:hypothetical protein [Priestia aryabhattai]|nr:hypothetical protein [Priestia sp. OVL9]
MLLVALFSWFVGIYRMIS